MNERDDIRTSSGPMAASVDAPGPGAKKASEKRRRTGLLFIGAGMLAAAFCLLAFAVTNNAPGVAEFNFAVNSCIQSARGFIDGPALFFTTIGEAPCMGLIALAFAAILLAWGNRRSLAGYALFVAAGVVIAQSLKLVFMVARPQNPYLVALPSSYSFPSGHSACSLIVLGTIAFFLWRRLRQGGCGKGLAALAGAGCLLIAALIALSRIYLGVHWPTDILGGWLLGGAWLLFCIACYRTLDRKA